MKLRILKHSIIIGLELLGLADSSNAPRSEEGNGFAFNSTTHRHSLGLVRPVEEAATIPIPAVHGHRYTPGQHRPVLAHATSSSSEPTTESKTVEARQNYPSLTYPSNTPFIDDLNATATTLTTRTGVRSISNSVAYSLASATTTEIVQSSPNYESVPIMITQVSPPAAQLSPSEGLTTTMVVTRTTNKPTILRTTITIDNRPDSQSILPSDVSTSAMETGATSGQPTSQFTSFLGDHNSTRTSQSVAITTIFASAMITGAASGPPDYHSVTTALTQKSFVISPQFEVLTGPPWTLPACNGPSPGPGLTPVGCTLLGNRTTTPQSITSYSCSEFNNQTTISTVGAPSKPQAVTTSAPSPNQSQSWTSDSIPCADSREFECAVNGSSIITLGPISQILGPGTATAIPSPASSSESHSQNWTTNSTPCSDNKSFECVDTGSGIITLGPIASLKYAQLWTSNSTPCADNNSFECAVNGSSTITLGPVASLTPHPSPSTYIWSTNTGLISTTLSELGLLEHPSTILFSATNSGGEMETTAPDSSLGSKTDSDSSSSIFTSSSKYSSHSQPTITPLLVTPSSSKVPPHDPYPYPKVSSGSVKRSKAPILLLFLCSLASIAASIDVRSAKAIAGRSNSEDSSSTSVDIYGLLMSSPLISTGTMPGGKMEPPAPNSSPDILMGSTVPADNNVKMGVPPTSTDIYYGPQIATLGAVEGLTISADGNWGVGVPHTATSTVPQNGQYSGDGGKSSFPVAIPASTTLTHAVSGASASFSPFPTNFIQPVTGSGTEASKAMSSSSVLSKSVTSGTSKLRLPGLFLFSRFFLHLAATGVSTPTLYSKTRTGSALERVTSTTAPISLRQDPPPDPLRSVYLGTQTITLPPASNRSPKLRAPFLLLFCVSLVSLGLAAASIPTPDSSTHVTSTHVVTQSATDTVSSSRHHGPIPVLSGPGTCGGNASLECVVQGGSTFTVETLSPQGIDSSPTPEGSSQCASNTNLKCVVQGGNTITVKPLSPLSALTMVPTTATTAESLPATSKPASSGAFNVKIPFLLLLFWSLRSLAVASIHLSPRGVLPPSDVNTTPLTVVPTLNPLFPSPCASNTGFECIAIHSFIITVGTLMHPPTTLQTAPGTAVTGIPPSATTAPVATSKPATSDSTQIKVPSFLLVFSSFFANSWANLFPFPTQPTVKGRKAKIEAMSIRKENFEAMTISLPPTSASISLPKHDAVPTLVVVQSSAVTVVEPAETTSQGLRRIATPFFLLMMCCVAATLYTATEGRKKHKKRDGFEAGDTVVQPPEYDFDVSGYK